MKANIHWQWETSTIVLSYALRCEIPFFPREGDEFTCAACSPFAVSGSEWDTDNSILEVYMVAWNKGDEQAWEDVHEMMSNAGWTPEDFDYYEGHEVAAKELFLRLKGN